MRQTGKTMVATTVRGGFLLLRSLVIFTIAGFITGIVVYVLTASSVNQLCSADVRTSLVPQCATSTAVLLLFSIGFPIAFFVAGKIHGIGSVLTHSAGQVQGPLATTIARHVLSVASRRGLDFATLGQHERTQMVIGALQKIDGQPRLIRWLGRALLDRVNYVGSITQFLSEQSFDQLSNDQIEGLLAGKLEEIMAEYTPEASLTMLWVLLGIAALLVVTLRMTLGA